MHKNFDDLTIIDDYMFYRVMENTDICKTLLNIVLHDKTETIIDIQLQKTIADAGNAKGVRFDVWAKDCNGTIYDVEMPFSDRHPCLSENSEFCIRKTSLLLEPPPSVAVFEPAFLKIGGADSRRKQKTPAGVLFARRGLFFVK